MGLLSSFSWFMLHFGQRFADKAVRQRPHIVVMRPAVFQIQVDQAERATAGFAQQQHRPTKTAGYIDADFAIRGRINGHWMRR